jgi:hypothetical protein
MMNCSKNCKTSDELDSQPPHSAMNLAVAHLSSPNAIQHLYRSYMNFHMDSSLSIPKSSGLRQENNPHPNHVHPISLRPIRARGALGVKPCHLSSRC